MAQERDLKEKTMSELSRTLYGTTVRVSATLDHGRYVVESILAAGGQGFVIVAQDRRLAGNRVLIKAPLYDPTLLSMGSYDFVGEKQTRYDDILYEVAMVDHLNSRVQNVPRIIDYFEDDNVMLHGTYTIIGGGGTWTIGPGNEASRDLFMVYELLSSGQDPPRTLGDIIADQGPQDERFVLIMARQMADVFSQLHEWNEPEKDDLDEIPDLEQFYYLYQDLKPDNILVTGEEVGERYFFLVDFGGVTRCNVRRVDRRLVHEISRGTSVYTLGYAAPEVFEDKRHIDQGFDIFTLGATMFHTFTGESPTHLLPDAQQEGAPDFGFRRLNQYRVFQEAENPLIREIVFRSTRADRRQRYGSIEQMRKDIMLALEVN